MIFTKSSVPRSRSLWPRAWAASLHAVLEQRLLSVASITTLALLIRLLHYRFSAKLLLVDDAVFFDQHARRFLATWQSFGTPAFLPMLVETIDHASLQGVVYPAFQSLIYLAKGEISYELLALAQVALSAVTVTLTALTARRAFGAIAGVVAGLFTALYPPLILSSTLLLAESLLIFVQALALYLAVRGLDPDKWGMRLLSGVCIGVLMLRPAFQYAGPLLTLALFAAGWLMAPPGRRVRRALTSCLPFLAGVLLIAVPWVALNGSVYGQYVWSRTGDAWQQIYWGIYPPNRGWWPPDSPVPPRYGVDSIPGARSAGMTIHERDLDYLEAAIDQVRATPLKAAATEVNKLYQAFLHPFNAYAEGPFLLAGLSEPVHRLLAILALLGLCLFWTHSGPALVLAAALVAISLPFLASHIDVRYTIPPAQLGAIFAGLAVSQLVQPAREHGWRRRVLRVLIAVGLAFGAHTLGVQWLLFAAPNVTPWHLHLIHAGLVCLMVVTTGLLIGRWLASVGNIPSIPSARTRLLASGSAAGSIVALLYGVQAVYDGDWHQWTATLRPGMSARQRIDLPPDWQPPRGGRAEVRLYLSGTPDRGYDPVVRVNGIDVARLGPALSTAGPLRFWEQIMVAARHKGMTRAEVPQWVAVPIDLDLLQSRMVEVQLSVEPIAPTGQSAVRLWGDYAPRPGIRAYEGPAVYTRIQGQNEAFHKFIATNEYAIWRWQPLHSLRSTPSWTSDAYRPDGRSWQGDDLSDAPGRQTGTYRVYILVYGPNHDLVAAF